MKKRPSEFTNVSPSLSERDEYRISSPKMSFFLISKFRLYPRATILLPINHNILKSLVFVIFDNIEDDLVI